MCDKLPEAKTFFEIIAECPICGDSLIVDFIEPYDEQMTEVCSNCLTEFKYKSPELVH